MSNVLNQMINVLAIVAAVNAVMIYSVIICISDKNKNYHFHLSIHLLYSRVKKRESLPDHFLGRGESKGPRSLFGM